jgi:hypothetical protein
VAEGVEVRVVNQAAFDGALGALAKEMADLRAELTDAGAVALEAARTGAPRRTGAMAAAHEGTYRGRNRYSIVVAHPGASAVHWGWPGHGIRRQPWVVSRFNRDRHWEDRLADGLQAALDKEAAKVR